MSDATSIVFAIIDEDDIKIIDYYENTGHEIKHYLDIIYEKGYNYAGHYMPHDAKKKRMSNTGTNILDFCRTQYGFEARPIPKLILFVMILKLCVDIYLMQKLIHL